MNGNPNTDPKQADLVRPTPLDEPSADSPSTESVAREPRSAASHESHEQIVEVKLESSQMRRGGGGDRSGKASKKRPCFHCGAMTSVDVLAVTGDLCWSCYSPAGKGIIKWLIIGVLVIGSAIGGVVWYRNRDTASKTTVPGIGETTTEDLTKDRVPEAKRHPGEITSEQKVRIVKLHLLQGVPLPKLVEQVKRDMNLEVTEDELQSWRKQFVEAGERAFASRAVTDIDALGRRLNVIDQKMLNLGKLVGELRQNLDLLRKESAKYEGTSDQRYILDPNAPPPAEK